MKTASIKKLKKLINDILYISDDDCDVTENEEEVTLEEIIDAEVVDMEKKYTQKCDSCDFEPIADKKYLAFRLITSHRNSCCPNKMRKTKNRIKCNDCDIPINEISNMKRHMRDVHADKTDSTSPPQKKKKNKVEDSNDSIVEMEI